MTEPRRPYDGWRSMEQESWEHDPEPVRRRAAEAEVFGIEYLLITLGALLVIIAIAVVALVNATPRPAPTPDPGGAGLAGAPHERDAGSARAQPRPQLTTTAVPRYAGTATWYCSSAATCTHGYQPGDLIAAIDRKDSEFRKGDRVTVRSQLAGERAVTVTIVDTCACSGIRVIDLSRAAFARLANPDLGVIPVTLELAGADRAPTGPPTDTAR